MSKTSNPDSPNVYYPAFLNLEGKRVVVVGGGRIAERKILALLDAGADLIVISPEITGKIEKEKKGGRIKHLCRQYRRGDLRDAFLVIAATDSTVINKKVFEDAPCLLNVVDTPQLCNFIVPSVMKRGALTIAVSTSGISPALSRSLRKELERLYGPEFSEYLESVRSIRAEAMKRIGDRRKRSRFLKSLASEQMLKILRSKGCREAKKLAAGLLKRVE